MSSQQEQAMVQAASDVVIVNSIYIASLALLTYDSLLTLIEEVPYIWKQTWKLGTALYVLARYPTILSILTEIIIFFFNFPSLQRNRTCNAVTHFHDALSILPLIGVQGLLLARAYAVTDHKRLALAVLGVLGTWAVLPDLTDAVLNDCVLTSARLHAIVIVGYVGSIGVILFDTTVVVVTLAGTLGTWRIYKRSTWNGLTFAHLLAEQSLMRFGFVLTITVADTILPSVLRPTISAVLGPIQNSLSTIIICRFHLDLQRRNAQSNSNASRDLSITSIGSFRATSQKIHEAIMAEFGGSLVDGNDGAEGSRERMGTGMPAGTTDGGIELHEVQSQMGC